MSNNNPELIEMNIRLTKTEFDIYNLTKDMEDLKFEISILENKIKNLQKNMSNI